MDGGYREYVMCVNVCLREIESEKNKITILVDHAVGKSIALLKHPMIRWER